MKRRKKASKHLPRGGRSERDANDPSSLPVKKERPSLTLRLGRLTLQRQDVDALQRSDNRLEELQVVRDKR